MLSPGENPETLKHLIEQLRRSADEADHGVIQLQQKLSILEGQGMTDAEITLALSFPRALVLDLNKLRSAKTRAERVAFLADCLDPSDN